MPKAFWAPTRTKQYYFLLNVQETVVWDGDSSNKYLLSICSCIFPGQSCPPPLEISVHILAQASHTPPLPSFWFRVNFLPEGAAWDGRADAKRFSSWVLTPDDLIWMVWRKGTVPECLTDIREYKRYYFYQDPLFSCAHWRFLLLNLPFLPYAPEAYCSHLLRGTNLYTI